MHRLMIFAAMCVGASSLASAQTIGLAMPNSDAFLDTLASGVVSAGTAIGAKVTVTDAQADGDVQVENVRQLIAGGAGALIVNGVSAKAETEIAALAKAAHLPLVFVNKRPKDVLLEGTTAYVGSNEKESGTLQAREVCRLLNGRGTIAILMGELSHPAAKMRTQDVHDVVATSQCAGLELLEEQSANFSKDQAEEIVRVWLEAGIRPDAILANNDAMALGALAAIDESDGKKPILAGIDGITDMLTAMQKGDVEVSVLQDAVGQGATAVDVVRRLMAGQRVDPVTFVPFQLLTQVDAMRLLAERSKN